MGSVHKIYGCLSHLYTISVQDLNTLHEECVAASVETRIDENLESLPVKCSERRRVFRKTRGQKNTCESVGSRAE